MGHALCNTVHSNQIKSNQLLRNIRNAPLPSAFAIARSTEIDIITFEINSKPPSPLRQVETEPLFLIPSSEMAEADGTTADPLDLSTRE